MKHNVRGLAVGRWPLAVMSVTGVMMCAPVYSQPQINPIEESGKQAIPSATPSETQIYPSQSLIVKDRTPQPEGPEPEQQNLRSASDASWANPGWRSTPSLSINSFGADGLTPINGEVTVAVGTTVTFRVAASDNDTNPNGGQEADTLYYHWKATGGTINRGERGVENAADATWVAPPTPGSCTVAVNVNDSSYDIYEPNGFPPRGRIREDNRNDGWKIAQLKVKVVALPGWSSVPTLGVPNAIQDCPVGPITIEGNPNSVLLGDTVRLRVTARDRDTLGGVKYRDQLYALWFAGSPNASFPERPNAKTVSVACDQSGDVDSDSILWKAPSIAGTYTVKVRLNDTSYNNGVINGGWNNSGIGENKRNDPPKEIALAIRVRVPVQTIEVRNLPNPDASGTTSAAALGKLRNSSSSLPSAAGINSEVGSDITVTGQGQTANVRVALPTGARMVNPTSTTFSVSVGTPRRIRWKLSNSPGKPRVTVYNLTNGTQGSDSLEAIRIDSVLVAYRTSSNNCFPTTNDTVRIRAIIYARGANGLFIYTDVGEANNGNWFYPNSGNADTTDEDWNPKVISRTARPRINTWPAHWPRPTFDWRILRHRMTSNSAQTDARTYEYGVATSADLQNWGYVGTLSRGILRYRVNVTLDPYASWRQTKTSLDSKQATRIAVRDAGMPDDPQGRRSLEWMTPFLGQPYEFGGRGFGGRTGLDPNDSVGNGYSIDCSALISQGARKTGYNWPGGWYRYTGALPNVSRAISAIPRATFSPGDILNKPSPAPGQPGHVAACVQRNGDRITVIQSVGRDIDGVYRNEVGVHGGKSLRAYQDAGFVPRRLTVAVR